MRLYEWKNTNLRQRRSVQGQIQERDLVGAMNPPQEGFHISTWLNVSSADQVSLILNSTSHWSKDAETETPILWPPYVKSRLTGKDPEAGKDWGQEEKGVMEDGMVGWHHWLNEHEFEQALGDGEGQGSLACGSPQSCERTVLMTLTLADRSPAPPTKACLFLSFPSLCWYHRAPASLSQNSRSWTWSLSPYIQQVQILLHLLLTPTCLSRQSPGEDEGSLQRQFLTKTLKSFLFGKYRGIQW